MHPEWEGDTMDAGEKGEKKGGGWCGDKGQGKGKK